MGEPTTTLSIGVFIKMIGMALFSALIHAMKQYRTGGTKNTVDLIILGCISFFFGIVSGLLAYATVGGDSPMLFGVIGVSGWLGVEMSSILTVLIKNKLK